MAIFPEMDPQQTAQIPVLSAPMMQPESTPILPAPSSQPAATPPMVMPAQPSPFGGAYFNPMADRNPSVLQDPALQGLLKQAYESKLTEMINSNKGGNEGRLGQIFSGLAAIGMGAFGGPAGGMAATELVRNARADSIAAKTRADAHQQQSIMALRHLADIDATTGLKPWSQAMKDYRAAQGQGLKAEDLSIKRLRANDAVKYHEGLLAAKDKWRTTYETIKKDDQQLKKFGINFNYDKLAQAREIAEMQDKRLRDIASIQSKVRLQTATQADLTKRESIMRAYQHDNAWLAMETQKHNDYLEKLSHERDPLTGKPKFDDGAGNPIDFTKYKTDFTPMQPGQQTAPDPNDISDALDLLQQSPGLPAAPKGPYGQDLAQPQPAAAPQQPQQPQQQAQPVTPPAMPAAGNLKAGFQAIMKSRGMNPEDAKRLFIDAAMKRGMTYQQAVQALGGMK